MDTTDLFEDANDSLSGFLDINGLADMLPDLTNVAMFEQALIVVRQGRSVTLTMQQNMQLALAFISLVGLALPQKNRVMKMLSSIQAKVAPDS